MTARRFHRSPLRLPRSAARLAGVVLALDLVATAVAAFSEGCTLVVDPDAAQCHVDTDCLRFPRTRCIQGGCTLVDAGLDVAIDPGLPCTSTQDCVALHGSNWVCKSTRCQFLGSDDCGIVIGNYTSDDVLLLGAILPLYGPHQSTALPMERALSLAADSDFAGGLPFGNGDVRHHVALVLCNEGDNPVRAARHLTDDVGVPAIFGPAFGSSVIAVAKQVTIPKQVLLISPYATAQLEQLGAPSLVWRTTPDAGGEASAIAQLVSRELEPRLNAKGVASIAVAIVSRDDADADALHAGLLADLRFDGVPATSNAKLTDVSYGNPDIPAASRVGQAVAAIVTAKPQIVILVGNTEAVTIMGSVDAQLQEGQRPYYVASHGVQVQELLTLAAKDTDLPARTLITAPGGDDANRALVELRARYGNAYSDYSARTFGVAQAFDAFYALAYALSAVRNTDVNGTDISEGFKRVFFGPKPQSVVAAPEDIETALKAVRGGSGITLNGASGGLAFDPATSTPSSDVQVSCVTGDGHGGTVFTSAGYVWRAASGSLEGSLAAPCLTP